MQPPTRKESTDERDKARASRGQSSQGQSSRRETKSRDIDLDRVLYDPEYRQAVQQTLSAAKPPGRQSRDAKPQKG